MPFLLAQALPGFTKRALFALVWTYMPRKVKLAAGAAVAIVLVVGLGAAAALILLLNHVLG